MSGRPHALRVLLAAHSTRLKRAQQQLLKPQNTGGSDTLHTMRAVTEVGPQS